MGCGRVVGKESFGGEGEMTRRIHVPRLRAPLKWIDVEMMITNVVISS